MDYRFTMPLMLDTDAGPALIAEAEYKADLHDVGYPHEGQWVVSAIYVEDISVPGVERAWKRLVPGGQAYALALSHLMTVCRGDIDLEWRDYRAETRAGDRADYAHSLQE